MDISKLRPYAKALAAAGAAIGVTAAAISDGKVDASEAVAIWSAWAGVYAVYMVRNKRLL